MYVPENHNIKRMKSISLTLPIVVYRLSFTVFCFFLLSVNFVLSQAECLIDEFQASQGNAVCLAEAVLNDNPEVDLYQIPVVFHVVHNNGPELILPTRVNELITALNENFRGVNNGAYDTQIEFFFSKN